MENRKVVEHKIVLRPDTEIFIYCATCLRVLAEFNNTTIGTHGQAMAFASDHWGSYRENHLVSVASMSEKRMQFLQDDNEFRDISIND